MAVPGSRQHRHSAAPGAVALPAHAASSAVTLRARRPVARIHRTGPEASAATVPRSAAPDTASGRPAPTVPPLDLDRLDRDLWRRFEKRVRVEQQRRGRG